MAMAKSTKQLYLPLVSLFLLTKLCQAAFMNNLCTNTTIPASDFTFQANLNTVFRYLVGNSTTPNGFHVAVSGGGTPDAVYGLFLCRGDQNTTACHDCVKSATSALTYNYCVNYQQAFIWYEECMVRHTNESLFAHKMDVRPATMFGSDQNVSKSEFGQLEENVRVLLYNLEEEAAETRAGRKFATRVVSFPSLSSLVPHKMYALAQCTPDLSEENCTLCLKSAIEDAPVGLGGGMLQPSCNLIYDSEPFFYGDGSDFTPSSPPPSPSQLNRNTTSPASPTPPTNGKKNMKLRNIIISIVAPVSVMMVLLTVALCWYTRRLKTLKKVQRTEEQVSSIGSLEFDLGSIKAATNGFSPANKLGEGGFGAVYKGTLSNGREIAVKRLSGDGSKQGDAEFKNEILLLARLQHKNLVRLLGFCLEGDERILIYEYVPNASLDHFLFDSAIHGCLDWDKRKSITGGIVRGLLYLHEDSRLKIIHRDLKTSNILLDEGMNPKIADFGLAKLFSGDQTTANTSKIAGTYGYMAPEYGRFGLFSVKSDVYSFGVVLLEIICGQKNHAFYGEDNTAGLVSLVWKKWREEANTLLSIIDPTMPIAESFESEIKRYIHVALLCVQENAGDRPTMSSIVAMLSNQMVPLPCPSNPGYVVMAPNAMMHKREDYSTQSDNSKSSTTYSLNDNSVSDLLPR